MAKSRFSFRSALVLLILMFWAIAVNGQDFTKIKWLAGTWEGVGYVGVFPNAQALSFEFNYDSLSLSLRDVLNENLKESDPDYIHIDATGEKIEVYFLGEMKFENRRLLITKVSPDFMTLSLAHNRGDQAMLVMGSFKRKKKTSK